MAAAEWVVEWVAEWEVEWEVEWAEWVVEWGEWEVEWGAECVPSKRTSPSAPRKSPPSRKLLLPLLAFSSPRSPASGSTPQVLGTNSSWPKRKRFPRPKTKRSSGKFWPTCGKL